MEKIQIRDNSTGDFTEEYIRFAMEEYRDHLYDMGMKDVADILIDIINNDALPPTPESICMDVLDIHEEKIQGNVLTIE